MGRKEIVPKKSWRVSSRKIVNHCVVLRKLNIMGFRLNVSQSSDLSIPGCREAQGGRISIEFEREAFSLCAGPGIGKLCGLG